MDAEEAVTTSPQQHLHRRDGWDFPSVPDDAVHLMTQTMEAWIVADPDALERYYGQGFNRSQLPQTANLELAPKDAIASALHRATQATRKGAYHKIRHASDLLRLISPDLTRQRCPGCERMFASVATCFAEA